MNCGPHPSGSLILLTIVLACCLPLAAQPAGALEILAWTTYADMDREYPNTVDAILQYRSDAVFTEFTGTTAAELEAALSGRDVFLVPEAEQASSSQLRAAGSDWAVVLDAFAAAGGSVVVCGENNGRWGFLDAAGLLEYSFTDSYAGGRTFDILRRGHRLVRYISDPELAAVNATTAPYGEVYRSADGGKTWRPTPNLYGVSQAFCLLKSEDGRLFVGTGLNGDVFVSGGAATTECHMSCTPNSGTLPFNSRFTVTLANPTAGYRVAAGRIDVTTAAGSRIINWRAGYTILSAGEIYQNTWFQPLPATGAMLGYNWFDFSVVDVTPVPYNQPPNWPSGDEDTDCATIRGMAP